MEELRRGAIPFRQDASSQRFAVLCVIALICALTGGSSQATQPALLVLRPAMVVGIVAILLIPGRMDWRSIGPLPLLLALFAATMLIQLVPLPPALWLAMPGHDRYAVAVKEMPQTWRSITLTPDLTINSLLALLPALATLVAFAGMRDQQRKHAIWLIVAIALIDIVFVLVQVGGGSESWAFLYGQGVDLVPTGLLANRNHQALLLATVFPTLAVAVRAYRSSGRIGLLSAIGMALVLIPIILLSGSRTGTALAVVAVLASVWLLPQRNTSAPRLSRRLIFFGALGLLALLVVATVISGRALSIERLADVAAGERDMRWRALPTMVAMTRDFFPFGIGYGAFDPVFRGYEPDQFLYNTYFNRAHNDLLETLMSGGLPGLAVVLAFVGWFLGKLRVDWRSGERDNAYSAYFGRAASLIIILMLIASLVDYPLRTGIVSMVFSLACCWVAASRQRALAVRRN